MGKRGMDTTSSRNRLASVAPSGKGARVRQERFAILVHGTVPRASNGWFRSGQTLYS